MWADQEYYLIESFGARLINAIAILSVTLSMAWCYFQQEYKLILSINPSDLLGRRNGDETSP